MGELKRKFRRIHKLPTWLFFFPYIILKGSYMLFFRKRIIDPDNFIGTARGCIGVIWHNRLMYLPSMLPKELRKRSAAVVSASRDGQYLVDLIGYFGVKAMRGSSKKRGANALLGASRALQEGFNICFTPDGPRGPKYTMSKGAIYLASSQQADLVPVSINASRYWSVKSWDNFQIPKPFSTLTMVIGKPIRIPADLSDEELEEWQEKVKNALMEITID